MAMDDFIHKNQFTEYGINAELFQQIKTFLASHTSEDAWKALSKKILKPSLPFKLHLLLFSLCYPHWRDFPNTAAAWIPDQAFIQSTQLAKMMKELHLETRAEFHAWSVKNYEDFWTQMIEKLNIQFSVPPKKICALSDGVENPHWLVGAKLNIASSCFSANPDKIAVIQQKKQGPLEQFTYRELDRVSNQIANSLLQQGFVLGDAIAIDMPMHFHAVAIYLGIIKMGGVVISIADSFSADEIAVRLQITNTKGIFTQDLIQRDNKIIPLYEKVMQANAPKAIVLPLDKKLQITLRNQDIAWQDFLSADDHFTAQPCDPNTHCNILFSSGTTGMPKAIPWTHTTPIKVASDAYLHHDIQAHDILAWPTNLGWMMGPWLIFAALINHATVALFDDVPRDEAFGRFVQDAKVTMLGVVPTLVATWRQTHCMEKMDWQHIQRYSSTGECSNPEDMLYLMSLAGYKPIIEYCGGTEIGGAYITTTMIDNNYPAVFTTPTMGLDFVLIDEYGDKTDHGEVAIIPPSLGLSTELLNFDHHEIYFADMPKSLRRHGDQARRFADGNYCILGRVDDTMNLGGIKVSSAEIERVLAGTENIIEMAAIAVNLNQFGPSHLVIYAATHAKLDKENLKKILQQKISQHLNPLFKIHEVVLTRELPKTASNKIMRRVLRKQYEDMCHSR